MKKRFRIGLAFGMLLAMLLALCACGNQQGGNATESAAAEVTEAAADAASEAAADVAEAAGAEDYEDYIGYQFAGKDPWEGDLAITIRSIQDGKLTLKDGKLTVEFESGEVMTESSEGGSTARHAEALEDAAKTVVLEKEVLDK